LIENPSYQDFATHDDSAYPELWDGCFAALAPVLGPSGTRIHDTSGNAHWGNFVGLVPSDAWKPSKGVFGLEFTGDHTKHVVGSSGSMKPADRPLTAAFWFKSNAVDSLQWIYTSRSSVFDNNPAYAVSIERISDTSHRLALYSGAYSRSSNFAWDLEWHHYAVTWAADNACSFYRDGVFISSTTRTAGGSVGAEWAFGNLIGVGAGVSINGILGEFRKYRRILSASEIKTLSQSVAIAYTPRRKRRIYSLAPSFNAAWARGSNQFIHPSMIGVA
jgi:hypothetical protein